MDILIFWVPNVTAHKITSVMCISRWDKRSLSKFNYSIIIPPLNKSVLLESGEKTERERKPFALQVCPS